jgi:hypothetical protein
MRALYSMQAEIRQSLIKLSFFSKRADIAEFRPYHAWSWLTRSVHVTDMGRLLTLHLSYFTYVLQQLWNLVCPVTDSWREPLFAEPLWRERMYISYRDSALNFRFLMPDIELHQMLGSCDPP